MNAMNTIVQIPAFADFIKEAVDAFQRARKLDKSRAEIAERFDQDLLFLDSFQALFIDDEGNFIRNDNISEYIAVSQDIFSSIDRLLSDYKSMAQSYEESDSPDKPRKLWQRASRGVRWAICGQRKTMKVLTQYNAYTKKLLDMATLMTSTLAALEDGCLREFASRKQARRLLVSIPMRPDEFTAVQGRLQIDNEGAGSRTMGSYTEENGSVYRVLVEFRRYGEQTYQIALDHTRQLAWFVHRASLSETVQASSQAAAQAIPFVGYQHDPARHRDVFIFRAFDDNAPPISLNETIQNHGKASAAAVESTLGHRYMFATRLALMVFGLHNFQWTHRNTSSHSVSVRPSTAEVPQLLQLVGWEYAAKETDRTEPAVDNPGHDHALYRHPPLNSGEDHNPNVTRDIYSLGVVLLEIGLWTVAADILGVGLEPPEQAANPRAPPW